MKIYTKSGDKGETSLFGGSRISKDHMRIEAYGTIDELNSFLGFCIEKVKNHTEVELLKKIQIKLFDIGSILASPKDSSYALPEISEKDISSLETSIDEMNESLPPLKHFILPGGSEAIASTHLCRTVCRRAERRIVSVADDVKDAALIIKYINRLSDYFFIFGRYVGFKQSIEEIKWTP